MATTEGRNTWLAHKLRVSSPNFVTKKAGLA